MLIAIHLRIIHFHTKFIKVHDIHVQPVKYILKQITQQGMWESIANHNLASNSQ